MSQKPLDHMDLAQSMQDLVNKAVIDPETNTYPPGYSTDPSKENIQFAKMLVKYLKTAQIKVSGNVSGNNENGIGTILTNGQEEE